MPNGHYADDRYGFAASGVNSGVLQAPSYAGMYLYSSSGDFPSDPAAASNYWVDAVFNTGLVENTTPANGATSSSVITPVIIATVNPTVQSSTLSAVLTGANSSIVATTLSYNSSSNVVTITPSSALTPSTYYTVALSGTFDVAGVAVSGSYSWSFTTTAMATESLWSPSSSPTNPTRNDPRSVNLGIKFSSDAAGYISGIRFYKGPENTGTHIGYLWTSTGTLLASATFTDETASGWQQVNFSTPVAIAANTIYVASYFCPDGYYSDDTTYFDNSGVISGDLEAPSTTASGGNGMYHDGATGAFPALSAYGSNYWVDVVFNPGLVATTTPAPAASGVSPVTPGISAMVNPSVEASTLSFVLTTAAGMSVPATCAYNSATNVATVTPASLLSASTTYTVTLSGVFDYAGVVQSGSYSWSFTTAPMLTESLWSPSSSPTNPTRNDPRSVNLGIKFSSDAAGYISGIRFYKGPENTGTHIGYLWTSTGTLLASATFTDETASGWQQVNFSTPVAIAAKTIYVASYFCPDGYYSDDTTYFATSGVISGDLEAPSTTASGGNGMYHYGASGASQPEHLR